jgi:hypothetical protein
MVVRRSAPKCARLLLVGLALPVSISCSAPPRPVWLHADASEWPALQERLVEVRDARPRDPWAAVVHVTMRAPRTGHVEDGRGAIAIAPGRAVRMILVGGAGFTLLDAWVSRDRWRIAVPPANVVRRGGASDDPDDLPVGFLRWWFFTPLEGALFAAARTDSGMLWLLHDADAVIELLETPCSGGRLLAVTRRAHGRSETVRECRGRVARAGDWVEYGDAASGLGIRLVVESVASEVPHDGAFGDPDDAPGGT